MSGSTGEVPTYDFLAGGGEMGAKMRTFAWATTVLGVPSSWPQSLRSALSICLNSRFPIAIYWGPKLALLYNDSWSPIPGEKHPWALGRPGSEVWPEIWNDIGPLFERVQASGEGVWQQDELLPMHRHGYTEECYFNFTFSPIRSEDGSVAGIFNAVVETTPRVIGERRERVLRELAEATARARLADETCTMAAAALNAAAADVPFALLYLSNDDRPGWQLVARAGVDLPPSLAPTLIDQEHVAAPWPLQRASETRAFTIVADCFDASAAPLHAQVWPEAVHTAVIVPIIVGSGTQPTGFMIAGVSPRRAIDAEYQRFFERIGTHLAAALGSAQAYEVERKRAEALAELDRAKTAFFSNVSHEFRTPLTLLLGPIEEALTQPALTAPVRAHLQLAQRNALRLLKLVNSLLDFARIEAGRVQASYEPTDLATLTRDIASTFRSAIERAGLHYEVACEALPETLYIDREMWEKIVLNLLSNAFKFTLGGSISIRLRCEAHAAVLEVSDTGVGIPETELPRLFERFHRVEGTKGRSQEGSGIGLALVQELVKLHGGSIAARSTAAHGTTLIVRIPFGQAHLPVQPLRSARTLPSTAIGAQSFVQEALRWLPAETTSMTASHVALPDASSSDRRFASTFGARVVLADDNADMRSYVSALLAPFYAVEAVADGQAAFDAVRRERPALVLSDVMMPKLDGLALLQLIRSEPELQSLPVILLSARAGEESRVEGLDAGADDYVVKPFAARELLARVGALIELTQLRQGGEERLRLAIEGARMSTWDLDLLTGRAHWSSTHFELLGYEARGDGVGGYQLWRERLHPEDGERIDALFARAARDRTVYQTEHRIIRADTGEVRWLSVYGRFLGEGSGPASRSVGIMLDITDRKRAEEALLAADRRKDEFLATLAHELRNPLAPIRNAAQLLSSPKLDHDSLTWARQVIQRQVSHMALLLDDLLDIARITQGKLELKRENTPLISIVDAAVEAARPLIDSKNHQLVVTLPPHVPTVNADPLRLSQMLSNLLTNAAKYTDPGGHIELAGSVEGEILSLSVTDNGVGIEPGALDQIFSMFSQVEGSRSRSEGGLGIGLALVKGLAALHGGTVQAKSGGLGIGSQFNLRLPIVAAPGLRPVTRGDASLRITVRRILVADDNKDAAQTIAMLLSDAGHEVRIAHTGLAALSLARTFRPDMALLDIGMPELDGYQLARAIRKEPWGGAVRLIALTGWGQQEDKRLSLEAGFDRHLTKPVDLDVLETLISDT